MTYPRPVVKKLRANCKFCRDVLYFDANHIRDDGESSADGASGRETAPWLEARWMRGGVKFTPEPFR